MLKNLKKVLLLVDTSIKFGRELLLGVAECSRLHGSWVLYHNLPSYRKKNDSRMSSSRLKEFDGAIVFDLAVHSRLFEEIIKAGMPAVVKSMREKIPGLANIITDNETTGRMAAEHLLRCRLRHFAYCGLDDIYWSRERGKSFSKRLKEAGFETYFYKQPKTELQRLWENEQIIIADWLKSLPKPVGLMACSDGRGQGVIEACKIAGLCVPDDVAVIGVDNDDMVCELCHTPLSSIDRNTKKVGCRSAELLDKFMSGEKMSDQAVILRPTHIVTRQSTDILAIKDSEVIKAVRFIRQHSREAIQVGEVANAIGISRRVLERRFRRALDRSVHDEIKHVRIDQISRMLVETDLSVLQIALAFGYSGADHIDRYFRKEKQMSLLAYRKEYGSK